MAPEGDGSLLAQRLGPGTAPGGTPGSPGGMGGGWRGGHREEGSRADQGPRPG